MTISIGRFNPGADCYVQTFASTGDELQITGLTTSTAATALLQRQQILGLADNPDEPIVPLAYSPDPSIDGYYRVVGSSVSTENLPMGRFDWSISLVRVAGFAAPSFESVLLGSLRVNSHGIVTGTSVPWHAVPAATSYYDIGGALGTEGYRTGDNILAVIHNGSGLYDARARWAVPPSFFYKGAATLEVGTTLSTTVGHQIRDLPENWRLSNGLLRVTPVAGTARLDISCHNTATWDTPIRVSIGRGVIGVLDEFVEWASVTVLRNSPESVSIRLSAAPLTGALGTNFFTVDLTLRRGARMVEVVIASDSAFFGMIALTTAVACTAATGGIRKTTNDASGHRMVLSSPLAFTSDLVNGSIVTTASYGTFFTPFAVGQSVNASIATGLETAQSLIYQYMAAMTERLTLRGR